jgi:hypothetical protein
MKRTLLGAVFACLFAGLGTRAQPTLAFKLGTFERDGRTFVGVVLRDAVVIDLVQALELRPGQVTGAFTLNGKVMQDANTSLMIHNVFEQVSYASHIATLRAGDVIATGSPAGVGSARKPPIFLKAGDLAVCSYEGVGTLRNPVAGPD